MELVKRNIHMDCLKCKASTQMTLENDVIIPDSRPDVTNLIMDRGNVVIEETKTTEDHVNLRGRLAFRILYLTQNGAVGEESSDVAEMEGSIPFEETVFVEGINSMEQPCITWQLEDLSVAIINSRKFSVRSLITLWLSCEDVCEEEIAIDLFSEEPVEFRKKALDVATMAIRKKDIFRIKEEVEIPGSFPNIFSVIWSEIVPGAVEFKILEDKIAIQGELRTFFLYRGEGEPMELCHYETTLPFAGALECPGCSEGMIPEITYQVEGKELEIRPDFDGEERIIALEQCLALDIRIYEEERVDILADVYGVVNEVNVSEKSVDFRKLQARGAGKMKLASHFLAEDGTMLHKILHTDSKLLINEKTMLENGIALSGAVALQIFYESMNEEQKYGVINGSIPFQYVLEADGISEECICPVQATAEQITVSIIDTGEVDVKCVLFFRSNVYQCWSQRIVEQIAVSKPDAEKMAALPSIAVYLVREGDSLWDIGKRYYVPIETIKKTNDMESEEIKAGDRILIVK